MLTSGLQIVHSSAILGRFIPVPPYPLKKFLSDSHWSQEWSWELEMRAHSSFGMTTTKAFKGFLAWSSSDEVMFAM